MLRLGQSREEVGVVADQLGNPDFGARHRRRRSGHCPAHGRRLLAVAARPVPYVGGGGASWADFAEAIFAEGQKHGRAPVRVKRIGTKDYPTPAPRPANSRLDCAKLQRTYGVALPPWRQSLAPCVARLLAEG